MVTQPTGVRVSGPWRYHVNREVIVNEGGGWIPHCVAYRERSRSRSESAGLTYSEGNRFGRVPIYSESSYMLDRSNGDRKNRPDNGAELTLRKSEMRVMNTEVSRYRVSLPTRTCTGVFYPTDIRRASDGVVLTPSPPTIISDSSLRTAGATLVSRAIPTLPHANLSVTLGELYREGLPRASLSMLKSLRGMPRGAADDFLNYQFGWKPLLSDMQRLVESTRERNSILAQLARDSGRVVRRYRSLPPLSTTQVIPTTGGSMAKPPLSEVPASVSSAFGNVAGGPGTLTLTTTDETWLDAAFQYHLPLGDDLLSKWARYSADAEHLYGLSLNADSLWNLAPWSWLVDWFSNTGDVISNFTRLAQYGTVMRYGYVCRRVTKRYQFRGQFTSSVTRDSGTSFYAVDYTYTHMYRRKANPYGFGVTWDSLSKTQLAILAALGMTRGNRAD